MAKWNMIYQASDTKAILFLDLFVHMRLFFGTLYSIFNYNVWLLAVVFKQASRDTLGSMREFQEVARKMRSFLFSLSN